MVDERSDSGNINVFKLKAKYNEPGLLKDASRVARRINRKAAGHRAILGFIKRFGHDITQEAHIAWYEDELSTYFEEEKFNDARLSKLYRDIHDDIYLKNANMFNAGIIKMIQKSS